MGNLTHRGDVFTAFLGICEILSATSMFGRHHDRAPGLAEGRLCERLGQLRHGSLRRRNAVCKLISRLDLGSSGVSKRSLGFTLLRCGIVSLDTGCQGVKVFSKRIVVHVIRLEDKGIAGC